MNVLILGSGGREHAFAWKIAQSTKCDQLFVAPGNAGTQSIATNLDLKLTDFNAIGEFVKEESISMLIVGPEDPLVNGIRNYFEATSDFDSLMIIGPGKHGATLEGSKDFSKEFLKRHNIPTAGYETFNSDNFEKGLKYIEQHSLPIVLKADGLAAGKGVVISENHKHAKDTLKEMIVDSKFGAASQSVVIEEFLSGIELSVFVLTDGESYIILPEAKDYKRIGEGDTGLNTGGMGAISPVHFADEEFLSKVESKIIKPTIDGLKKDGIPYQGFVFIGLMNMAGEPYVIEYNVRMGDPETEVVLPRIKNDILDVFEALCTGTLSKINLQIDERVASTVIMVAGGYPEEYKKGDKISNLEEVKDGIVFHSGTIHNGDEVVTNGGRVLACTSLANSLEEALEKSFLMADTISWDGKYYRKDIGFDLK